MRFGLVKAGAVLVLVSCLTGDLVAQAPVEQDSLVYSTAVQHLRGNPSGGKLLIRSSTRADAGRHSADQTWVEYIRGIPGLQASTAEHFASRAKAAVRVPAFGIKDREIQIMDDSTLNQTQQMLGSAISSSSGIVSVTAIGYSSDRTQAVLAVDYVCGRRCGGGQLMVLERVGVGGVWIVTKKGGIFWAY